jgi:hypothetical protein
VSVLGETLGQDQGGHRLGCRCAPGTTEPYSVECGVYPEYVDHRGTRSRFTAEITDARRTEADFAGSPRVLRFPSPEEEIRGRPGAGLAFLSEGS